MTEDPESHVLQFAENVARERFRRIALRTAFVTPELAAAILRRLPEEKGFCPEKIAGHLQRLPEGVGESVQLGKSASQAFLSLAVPGEPWRAFEWAHQLLSETSATSVKMNFGPGKPTDLKIFWGKPEVNTLVEIGGEVT